MSQLYKFHLVEHAARGSEPLAYHFLSDANVAVLTTETNLRLHEYLGEIAPRGVAAGTNDIFTWQLLDTARKYGHIAPTVRLLIRVNEEFVANVVVTLATDALRFRRWEDYLKHGPNLIRAGRPYIDRFADDRQELHGLHRPRYSSEGGKAAIPYLMPHVLEHGFTHPGTNVQELTGSDEFRKRIIPVGPLPRHNTLGIPNYVQ